MHVIFFSCQSLKFPNFSIFLILLLVINLKRLSVINGEFYVLLLLLYPLLSSGDILHAVWNIVIKYHRFCLFDLILYVQSTIFQLNRDGSSSVEPVLS